MPYPFSCNPVIHEYFMIHVKENLDRKKNLSEAEAATRGVLLQKLFLEISQN